MKSISIHIPIYNQPEKCDKCLQSIANQKDKAFSVLLLDDCSTSDYSYLLKKYDSINIRYLRNKINLGAVPNMLHALTIESDSEFVMVFHEDDMMHPGFIRIARIALTNYPDAAFFCSKISFFNKYNEVSYEIIEKEEVNKISVNDYLREVLRGEAIGFGTIIYNKNLLKRFEINYKKFSVFGDRPFLIELAGAHSIIFSKHRLVSAYSHYEDDNRWNDLTETHLFNLYNYYKNKFIIEDLKDEKILKIGLSHGMISGYKLLPENKKSLYFVFIAKSLFTGLINLKYLLLSYPLLRKIIERIKKLNKLFYAYCLYYI